MFNFFKKKIKLHFLHIGKTGGTAIRTALESHSETSNYTIELHGHEAALKDIPQGELVMFFLRDPLARFVSAFYSRQRKGQPRYYSEWNPLEKKTFETFGTPNQFALSLANPACPHHDLTIEALQGITLFKTHENWNGGSDYFQSRVKDIFFIGFQESLDADFTQLINLLKIPPQYAILPQGKIASHKNPTGLDKTIEDSGVAALNEWYAKDIELTSLCKNIMSNKNKKRSYKSARA